MRVLITAFEGYDEWSDNASWLALVELTRDLPEQPEVTTRRYPVDYDRSRDRLLADLEESYDVAVHLGQSPGSARLELESVALNLGGSADLRPEACRPLVPGGPLAYATDLPLSRWARRLRQGGIPAEVSHHAGTGLCNALYYLSLDFCQRSGRPTRPVFLHLPLELSQTLDLQRPLPSLPAALTATALRILLDEIVQ